MAAPLPAFDCLVLSGGSLKGVSHVGAVRCLEEMLVMGRIMHFIGSSSGAIVSFLAAIGLTSSEMQDRIVQFARDAENESCDVDRLLGIADAMGLDDGSRLEAWLRDALESRVGVRDMSFIDLAKATGRNLVVSGTNLTRQRVEYFCVDATPSMDVVKAVRISMSIPIIFSPVFHDDCVYVDGGILDNFPIEYCRTRHAPVPNATLGITIRPSTAHVTPDNCSVPGLLTALFDCMFDSVNRCVAGNANVVRITFPESANVFDYDWQELRFSIPEKTILEMIQHGYECTRRKLSEPEEHAA